MRKRELIEIGSGINPLGPSKKVRAGIRKAIRRIGAGSVAPGRLRQFFSSKFRIPAESVVFGNSVEELLSLILTVVKPKETCLVGPAAGRLRSILSRPGEKEGRYLEMGEGLGFMPSAREISGHLAEGGIVIISNPNRVTGRSAEAAELVSLLKGAVELNNLVVIDESLVEFTGGAGALEQAANSSHIIALRTTALYYGLAGLELAYAVAPPPLAARLISQRSCGINVLAQEAAITALKDRAFREATAEFITAEKFLFAKSLSNADGVRLYQSDSNTFMLGVRPAVIGEMEKTSFSIAPFRPGPNPEEVLFAYSVLEHDKNKKFLRILKERVQKGH